MKKPLILSLSFHSFCFALYIGLMTLHKPKPLDVFSKPQKSFDVSFYHEPKPEPKTITPHVMPKPQIQKIQKTAKPITHQSLVVQKKTFTEKPSKDIVKKYDTIAHNNHKNTRIITQNSPPILPTQQTLGIQSKISHNPPPLQPSFNHNDYVATVKQKIARHKFYPNSAKRRAIEGRIAMQLSIKPNGTIMSLHITQSSGSRILDEAALHSVHVAAPFKAPQKNITFQFGMQFNLQDG